MSLINDALKRARQSVQRKNNRATEDNGSGATPLQPVYANSSDGNSFDWAMVKLGILALVVIGGIMLKVWPYFHHKTVVKAAAITPVHSTIPQNNAATNNNPIARAKRTFDKVHDLHKEGEDNYSMVDTKPKSAPVPVAPAKPDVASSEKVAPTVVQKTENATPAAYKLQAIFFREVNSSALINGRSVLVGDEVDGARVKSIAAQTVMLDYAGQTKELSLR